MRNIYGYYIYIREREKLVEKKEKVFHEQTKTSSKVIEGTHKFQEAAEFK